MKILNCIKNIIRKNKSTNTNDLVVGGSFAGYKIHIFPVKKFVPKYAPMMSEIIYYRSTNNYVNVMIKDLTFSNNKNINIELFTLPLEKDENGWFLNYKNMKLKSILYEEFEPEKIISETRTILKKVDGNIFIVFINDIFLDCCKTRHFEIF